jgi:hypothetical protein
VEHAPFEKEPVAQTGLQGPVDRLAGGRDGRAAVGGDGRGGFRGLGEDAVVRDHP